MHTLLLIDGHALAYRAYYAIRNLSAIDGTPTNALYGFIKMMRQLQQRWQPTHMAVVFDGGLPIERLEEIPEYKAQREEMPEPLSLQMELIKKCLQLSGMPVVRIDKQEADDILAIFAREAAEKRWRVLIGTHDKDLYQLVNEYIHIVPLTKSEEEYGPEEVLDKFGVSAAQIIDYLALLGDSSDNIPGVPGVGKKTAAKLLTEYGRLDQMDNWLDQVSSDRIRTALDDHRELIARNRRLVQLKYEMESMPPVEHLTAGEPQLSELHLFYRKYSLQSLMDAPVQQDLL